jgi:hypothetical protein
MITAGPRADPLDVGLMGPAGKGIGAVAPASGVLDRASGVSVLLNRAFVVREPSLRARPRRSAPAGALEANDPVTAWAAQPAMEALVPRAPMPTARADSRRRQRARTSRADTRLLAGWLAPERSSVTPSPRQSGHNPNIRTGSTHTRTGSTNTDTSNTGRRTLSRGPRSQPSEGAVAERNPQATSDPLDGSTEYSQSTARHQMRPWP